MMRILFIIIVMCCSLSAKADLLSGNVKGKVTLVEYYDYNCPICRAYTPEINRLKNQFPELKVIQRPVPVLARSSFIVDSVILATRYQHKFSAIENAIFGLKVPETIPFPLLMVVLHKEHINIKQLNQDMQKSAVQNALKNNLTHYSALGIHQVPVTLIYPSNNVSEPMTLIGMQSYQALQQAIHTIAFRSVRNNSNQRRGQ